MSTVNELLRPEPERDQWGRYKLVPAKGGKAVGHTRVTTFAKSIADTHNLTEWAKRNVAIGMARKTDLVAMAHGLTHDDRGALREVIEAAEEASGANERRRLGTALHKMCEQIDLGQIGIDDIPEAQRADVAAYIEARDRFGLEVVTERIEQVCVIPRFGLAGQYDRLYRFGGRLYVGDVKTGKEADRNQSGGFKGGYPLNGFSEIAIQLACYANAETTFDYGTHQHSPMPDVDKDRALVIHVPAGEGRCEIYWIDIAIGWVGAQLAADVRDFRKRRDLLAAEITGTPPVESAALGATAGAVATDDHPAATGAGRTGSPPERVAWALSRATVIIEHSDAARDRLTRAWPDGVPTFREAREAGTHHDDDQLDAIVAVLDMVEGEFEIPFGPDDPTATVIGSAFGRPRSIIEGPNVGPAEIGRLKASVASLDKAASTTIEKWSGEANAAGTPFAVRDEPTQRRYEIATAAVALAAWDDTDDAARTAIGAVLGEEVQASIAVGHALGSLTRREAAELVDTVARLAAGAAITFDDSGRPIVAA